MLFEGLGNRRVARRYDHRKTSAVRRLESLKMGQAQHDRLAPPDGLGHRGNALDDPALTEIVVGDEDAIWLQHSLDVGKCLFRKQVALQANARIAAMEDKGIDEGVND